MKLARFMACAWWTAATLLVPAAPAASTVTWEMSTYRDFLAGRFLGVSLHKDGRLTLAPRIETVFASDQPVIWALVQAPDGTIYAGTGHRGRVFKVDRTGKASLVWTADQPEVFALALDSKGVLYAATSPDGKIYRFENGQPVEYYAPKAHYIWALAFSPDGKLYVGTGDQGKIFRVDGPGKGEVYYETGQSHITCLAFDREGRLLAGSEPNGIIYRISAKDKAFVLYDANLPEIRAIVPGSDGAIYAAALGGSLVKRPLGATTVQTGAAGAAAVPSTSTTVTVTEEVQTGLELKPKAEAPKPVPAAPATTVSSAVIDVSGVEKSALYRIAADNTVETLWSSKEENIYDVLFAGGHVVFATDGQGRVYRLSADRKTTLVAQTNEGEATRLLSTNAGLLAATGDLGKIFRFGDNPSNAGSYESPVHDAGTVARWGRVSWRGESIDEGRVKLRTRTGNSARPDKTWSEWSEPLSNGSLIPSPNARYVQWKAELAGSGSVTPALDSVTVAYLPQNTAPVLKSITVISQVAASAAAKPAAPQTPAATYSITVTDTGEAPAPTSGGTPTQTVGRAASEQLQITWQPEDPDGDKMVYSLYFRGEDEREWKTLKTNLTENTYLLDADVLADGKYFFRVTASDLPANPPSAARLAELISAPVLIDHTPPLVKAAPPRRTGTRLEIEFEAADAASALRRSEYSLDAGPWTPVEPLDGVLDSREEKFRLELDNISAGEHLVVVRVFDSSNNAGLAKVVVR